MNIFKYLIFFHHIGIVSNFHRKCYAKLQKQLHSYIVMDQKDFWSFYFLLATVWLPTMLSCFRTDPCQLYYLCLQCHKDVLCYRGTNSFIYYIFII